MNWIKISDRMPTEEEEDKDIEWWDANTEKAYPGMYSSYDGKGIVISGDYWTIKEPLTSFTH